jgi:ATP-dependent Clp protease ATP-binding subunit ClpC
MLGHHHVGTEHVLLGLAAEGGGIAAKALESLNISLEALRQQVEEMIGQGQAAPTGHIPFTPRAKKALELSLREALQLGHILLGLIREGEGVAAQVLQKLGADVNRVRQTVIQFLSGYTGGEVHGVERDPGEPVIAFSDRERIVLSFLVDGAGSRQIAAALGVPPATVREIVRSVIKKLQEAADA